MIVRHSVALAVLLLISAAVAVAQDPRNKKENEQRLVVVVDEDGTIRIAGARCDPDNLRAYLFYFAEKHRGTDGLCDEPILIRGHPNVDFEHLQCVMNTAADQKVKIWKVQIAPVTPAVGVDPLDIPLPRDLGDGIGKPEFLTVSISHDKGVSIVYVNRKPVERLEGLELEAESDLRVLDKTVGTLSEKLPDRTWVIDPGKGVPHAHVVRVLNVLMKHRLEKVTFTIPSPRPKGPGVKRDDSMEIRKARDHATIVEHIVGPNDPKTATAVANLGSRLQHAGRLDEARTAYERALAIREASLGIHEDTAQSLEMLARVLLAQGEPEEANKLLDRSLEIRKALLRDGK